VRMASRVTSFIFYVGRLAFILAEVSVDKNDDYEVIIDDGHYDVQIDDGRDQCARDDEECRMFKDDPLGLKGIASAALANFVRTPGNNVKKSYCEGEYESIENITDQVAMSAESCATRCSALPWCVHFSLAMDLAEPRPCRLSRTCREYTSASVNWDGYKRILEDELASVEDFQAWRAQRCEGSRGVDADRSVDTLQKCTDRCWYYTQCKAFNWDLSASGAERRSRCYLIQGNPGVSRAADPDIDCYLKADLPNVTQGEGEPWQAEEVPNLTAALLCSLFRDANTDLKRRKVAGYTGWVRPNGSAAIPVPYAVMPSQGRGLGLFLLEAVARGTVVHRNLPEQYVRLPSKPAPGIVAAVAGCSVNSGRKVTQWCVEDDTHNGDGLLCEIDDGRYVNDRNPGEVSNIGTCPFNRHWTCATRDIAAGKELLEDYTADGLDDGDLVMEVFKRYRREMIQNRDGREASYSCDAIQQVNDQREHSTLELIRLEQDSRRSALVEHVDEAAC